MPKKEKEEALYLLNRQRKIPIDKEALRLKAKRALRSAGLEFNRLGIILVSDKRIACCHREYLGQKAVTDVISFKTGRGEGEILISAETARQQALDYRHPLERELLILIIHGFLHLAGHRDARLEDRRRMEAETDRIMAEVEKNDDSKTTQR